jgi:hypothetical protein
MEVRMTRYRRWLYVVLPLLLVTNLVAQVASQVIQGEELEQFLRQGKIVRAQDIGKGVTLPLKLTMDLNGVTRFGVFKSIDVNKPVQTFGAGGFETAFQDSWKTEIAAYEVDKIIGLGMVPATVERNYAGKTGSAQFWVDSIMEEGERVRKKIQPPDAAKWNQLAQTKRLFDALIYNTDRNLGNTKITKDWEIILLDHSRTFRPFKELKDPKTLTRFSKSFLEGIQRLNEKDLIEKIGNYLSKDQIRGLLTRRDLILDLSKKMVAEQGEARVLYP